MKKPTLSVIADGKHGLGRKTERFVLKYHFRVQRAPGQQTNHRPPLGGKGAPAFLGREDREDPPALAIPSAASLPAGWGTGDSGTGVHWDVLHPS